MYQVRRLGKWPAIVLALLLAFLSMPLNALAEEVIEYELDSAQAYSEVLNYPNETDNDYSVRHYDIDPLFAVPYVSTYYFNPKPYVGEDIIIPIYITDSVQSEYFQNDTTITLDVIYEIDGVQTTFSDIPLGDYDLNIGSLSEGMHVVAIQTYDKRSGMKSHKLYNDLWVIDPQKEVISAEETYYMSEADLIKYKINNEGSTDSEDLNNTRDGLTQLFMDVRAAGKRKIVLLEGTYRIDGTVDRDKCISIPSYLTVDMNNSTFKLNPVMPELNDSNPEKPASENKAVACIVTMNDVVDAHLINGTIEGDRFERQEKGLETVEANRNAVGEQIMAVSITGGKYCSISNLIIKNTTGYTVGCGAAWGKWEGIYSYTRTAIINGEEVANENCSTSKMMDLTKYIDWNPNEDYMYVGHFLGVRGILGESEIVYVSFYDKDSKFMSTVTAYQYRKILIPEGAKYARITVAGSGFPYADNSDTLFIYAQNMTEYNEITNIDFYDTRTCALVPTSCNNLLIESNTYTRCGNSVTTLAVDFEDGWEECQDIYYRNNTVLEEAGTGTIVDCAGMNHVYENNIGHSIEIRNRLAGGVVRNTNDPTSSVKWDLGNWKTGFFGRIYNNNIGNVEFRDGRVKENKLEAEKICVDFKVKNCTITNGDNTTTWIAGVPDKVVYENCTFTHLAGHDAIFKNCIIQPGNQLNNQLYFYDCTFKAVDGVSDSISLNLSTPFDADRLFENCTFEGKTTLGGFFHSGVFRGCEFEDVAIYTYVNSTEASVLFENCKINSTSDNFIKNGPYAKLYDYVDFRFRNCEITHSGKTLIYFSAEPTTNSQFLFEECSIKNTTEWLTRWETGYWAEQARQYISVTVQLQIPSTGKNGTTYRYSVKEYADYILSNTDKYSANEVDMIKAMLNYGGYAQQYFGVNIHNLANESLYSSSDDPVLNTTQSITSNAVSGTMTDKNLTYLGASLVCDGSTGIKLYFKINSGMDEATILKQYSGKVTLNGKERKSDVSANNGLYVICLYDITAAELDSYFSFVLTNTTTKSSTIKITYSPKNYMAIAQNSDNSDLKNLVRAMYIYNQAAKKLN